MLNQINIYGDDRVQVAIKRIQTFEPPDGYYLAFSGGKDSVVVKRLMDMAGVKYDAHYNVTTVDPPELVQFIRDKHPDVHFDKARYKNGKQITMWNLIPSKKMPPTRIVRYCCQLLKEGGGEGRFKVTGVRKSESAKRSRRAGIELSSRKTTTRDIFDPDNPRQELIHYCRQSAQKILNPIIDWTDEDVWEFIQRYDVPYCELYDKGYKRLGCIGCPMSSNQKKELESYPKFKKAYLSSFERMLAKLRSEQNREISWKTAEDVMKWWIGE